MPYTKPTALPAWAESGDKVQPTNAEIQTGWPLSSTPPSRQRFNWVLNYVAQAVRYLMQRGIPEWDAAEDYPQYARVQRNGDVYTAVAANANVTPGTDPAKWVLGAASKGVTQAQFDNSTNYATTAFVNSALGNFAGLASITAAGNIAAADAGKVINVAIGSAGQTVGLPSASLVPLGKGYHLINNGSAYTISRTGTDTLSADGSVKTSLSVPMGGAFFAISNGSNGWLVFGSGLISQQGDMAGSTASSGFQKLPSGVIIQWGSVLSANLSTTTVTLPIAFPNEMYQVLATGYNISGGIQATVTANSPAGGGLSQVSFNAFYASAPGQVLNLAATGQVRIQYIAIGR